MPQWQSLYNGDQHPHHNLQTQHTVWEGVQCQLCTQTRLYTSRACHVSKGSSRTFAYAKSFNRRFCAGSRL